MNAYLSELEKLQATPRFTPTTTNLLGTELELVDSASFLAMYKEIFEQQIYRFKTAAFSPTIIDCGANIGLSVVYFKLLYPHSQIIAFEPDVKIYNILKKNVENFRFSNVELINKANWSSETVLEFMAEGADGGRVLNLDRTMKCYRVPTVRLKDYLNKKIDFLKIDIEGAETEVMQDCKDLLFNVDHLFVEYHAFENESQTLPELLAILKGAGFRFHIHAPVASKQPFCQRHVNYGLDMQVNIFAFKA